MEKYDVAVIGAGPAGMIAAIRAAELLSSSGKKKNGKKRKVVLIEKNDYLGKKLLLTGGGRCNLTNTMPLKDMVKVFGKKGSFLKPSLYNLDNNALLDFFREKGLEFKVEDKGRVFPEDDKATSILRVLKTCLNDNNVKLRLNSPVKKIKVSNETFDIILSHPAKIKPRENKIKRDQLSNSLKKDHVDIITASNVIIATGGVSYPSTGSTGTGLKIAKKLGHNITSLDPSLVPLRIQDDWIKELSGMKLEDVVITLKTGPKKKISGTGTVLFTHFGLSGPGILDLSHEVAILFNKILNKSVLESNDKSSDKLVLNQDNHPNKVNLYLDLLPETTRDELSHQLVKDFQKHGNRIIKTYMKLLLPNNMISPFLERLDIDPKKNLSSVSRKERNSIINHLKNLEITVTGTLPVEKGMVTCGGVSFKDINSKTMESKLVQGLYFAGEIIEFCGPTGGYNLQMAFSTGYTAGENASKNLSETY